MIDKIEKKITTLVFRKHNFLRLAFSCLISLTALNQLSAQVSNKFAFSKPYIALESAQISQEPFKAGFGAGYFAEVSSIIPGLFLGTQLYSDWLGVEFGYSKSGNNQTFFSVNENSIMPGYNLSNGALDGGNFSRTFKSKYRIRHYSPGVFFNKQFNNYFSGKLLLGFEQTKFTASITNVNKHLGEFPMGSDSNSFDSAFKASKIVPFIKIQGGYQLYKNLKVDLGLKWSQTSRFKKIDSLIVNMPQGAPANNLTMRQRIALKDYYAASISLRYSL